MINRTPQINEERNVCLADASRKLEENKTRILTPHAKADSRDLTVKSKSFMN